MRSKLFFLILLIASLIPVRVSSEGYGEDSPSLGQLVDDYENANNVSVAYQVINNVTLDCMELNYSSSIAVMWEDWEACNLNAWTDSGNAKNRMSCSPEQPYTGDYSLKVQTYAGKYDADWIWRTFSAGNQFEIQWFWRVIGFVSNPILYRIVDNAGNNIIYFKYTADNLIFHSSDGGWQNTPDFNPVINVWYKLNIVIRVDDTDFDLSIDDDLKISEKDWSNVGAGEPYAMHFMTQTGSAKSKYYADDVSFISGGYFSDGYFNTTDYFDYVNGSSLVWLSNTTIESETGLKVQFSNDEGSSWVDNEGNAGSNTLTGGFEALDLRDLNYTSLTTRYNLTSNGADTPRVFQSRLITTEGPVREGPGPGITVVESDAPWIALAIILSIIAFLLAMGVKR